LWKIQFSPLLGFSDTYNVLQFVLPVTEENLNTKTSTFVHQNINIRLWTLNATHLSAPDKYNAHHTHFPGQNLTCLMLPDHDAKKGSDWYECSTSSLERIFFAVAMSSRILPTNSSANLPKTRGC
jgi:hypothetical protein